MHLEDRIESMRWPARQGRLDDLKNALSDFSMSQRQLLGASTPTRVDSLAMQMISSLRRLDYTNALLSRPVSARRGDPNSPSFDPERAAILHYRNGNLDEAAWLLLLTTNFGKNKRHGWRTLVDVYSGLGDGTWTWPRVAADPTKFCVWLEAHAEEIGGAFGNHRKYESLTGQNGTGAVVASYVRWIGPEHSHTAKFSMLIRQAGNDPHTIFDAFYEDMHVHRFGRLGKFDFLALLGRMGFVPMSPGKAYLAGATGPLKGARLLFANDQNANIRAAVLEGYLQELDTVLSVGMQVMEDSLCNWQKSPDKFIHFIG
jgi:hypothetical protein